VSTKVTPLPCVTLHYGRALQRYHGGGNTTFCTAVTHTLRYETLTIVNVSCMLQAKRFSASARLAKMRRLERRRFPPAPCG
jgi:hypothetical protein